MGFEVPILFLVFNRQDLDEGSHVCVRGAAAEELGPGTELARERTGMARMSCVA